MILLFDLCLGFMLAGLSFFISIILTSIDSPHLAILFPFCMGCLFVLIKNPYLNAGA